MEIVLAFAGKVAEYTVEPIARQLGYLFCYKSNIDNLKTQVKRLEGAKDRVQNSVNEEWKINAKEIETDVRNWLAEVTELMENSNKLLEYEGHAKTGCTSRAFPNLWLRHQLSRRANKMALEAEQIEARGKFDRVSYLPTPQGLGTEKHLTDYNPLESRNSTLKEIMKTLKDENVSLIGIWGAGGVGKTTLAMEVARQSQEEKFFDVVVMATVSPKPDEMQVQQQIAELLGLKFTEDTVDSRAIRLRERIKREERILVILDDLWNELNLEKVGIPRGDDHYKGCKVLLTSRNLDVLTNKMGAQKNFPLEVLQEEEAWNLFAKMAGDVVKDRKLQPVAIEVARGCAGLPVLIVSVAKALQNKNFYVWKDALKQLERISDKGEHAKVYNALELSYNQLENEEAKSLFLLIGLLGHSYIWKYQLLLIGSGLRLFQGVDTLESVRNRIHTLTSALKNSCLLLEDKVDKVKMHDVVREVAISIASKDQNMFSLKVGSILEEWPDLDQLKRCHKIFMPFCYFDNFPQRLEAPELQLLVMQLGNDLNSPIIPEHFFEGMKELKVLDVVGNLNILSPPPSIGLLKNLRALGLARCLLGDMAIVGELKNLEILKLNRSTIKELPIQFRQLHRLQLLDLNDCFDLKVIAPGVISSLKSLQELFMGNTSVDWYVAGQTNQSTHASLNEMSALHHLERLDLTVKDGGAWPVDLFFKRLEKFRIHVGSIWYWGGDDILQTLKLQLNRSIQFDRGIKALLAAAENLALEETWGFKNVLYDLDREGFPHLKYLTLKSSGDIGCIIDFVQRASPHQAFPSLESLQLDDLNNLELIFHGPMPDSFCNLRIVKATRCHNLRSVFLSSKIGMIPQLAELEVTECNSMEEIIFLEEEDANREGTHIVLPQLQSLTLELLPALISFCCKERRSYPSQLRYDDQMHEINEEHSFIPLFNEKVSLPKLERLILSSISCENIWSDQLSAAAFIQNLTVLTVVGFGGMKHLLTLSMVRSLLKLKHLEIRDCPMMENIYNWEEIIDNPTTHSQDNLREVVFFPNLETMIINSMQNLTTIWHHQLFTPNSFCKLKKVEIRYCHQLKTIFPSYTLRNLPGLLDVTVRDCDSIEDIFEHEDAGMANPASVLSTNLQSLVLFRLPCIKHIWKNDPRGTLSFGNIRKIYIKECHRLNYILPASVAKCLMQLEMLCLESCHDLETVVRKQGSKEQIVFSFPQVYYVEIEYLPNLKHFYPGKHFLNWPMLKKLRVRNCWQAKAFASGIYGQQVLDLPAQQPFFLVEEIVPKLEELQFNGKDTLVVWNAHFHANIFDQVTSLSVNGNPSMFAGYSPSDASMVLYRSYTFGGGSIRLICSSSEDLFPYEKLLDTEKGAMARLFLQNLEILDVYSYSNLKFLVPPSVSFQNLISLSISSCQELVSLIALPTAQSLVQLRELAITNCPMIETIISNGDGKNTDEINFGELEYLKLDDLPSLKSFCSANCTLIFPSLREMVVRDCHKMEMFSGGDTITRLLEGVSNQQFSTLPSIRRMEGDRHIEPGEERWEGDLNSTIKQLHKEMVSLVV
ncbi:hypothetical protein L6164_003658 [Bauhinia variegata]|uniref:Uncharacterized protein n=1 Tax=Bauhinia variegata TaxID=167791 RepID=A0ACB9Q2K7_BAUVA|nr:hypothetical protein L6164_003658 [Bauhinia variegata]